MYILYTYIPQMVPHHFERFDPFLTEHVFFFRSNCRSAKNNDVLGGGNSDIFYVHPYLGENNSNLANIFQLGWTSTTNGDVV